MFSSGRTRAEEVADIDLTAAYDTVSRTLNPTERIRR